MVISEISLRLSIRKWVVGKPFLPVSSNAHRHHHMLPLVMLCIQQFSKGVWEDIWTVRGGLWSLGVVCWGPSKLPPSLPCLTHTLRSAKCFTPLYRKAALLGVVKKGGCRSSRNRKSGLWQSLTALGEAKCWYSQDALTCRPCFETAGNFLLALIFLPSQGMNALTLQTKMKWLR